MAKHPEFWKLYKRGLSDTAIARECNRSLQAVFYWRRINELPPNRRTEWAGKDYASKIARLYAKGYHDYRIAEILGCTCNAVTAWRKRNGLQRNIPPSRRKHNADTTC